MSGRLGFSMGARSASRKPLVNALANGLRSSDYRRASSNSKIAAGLYLIVKGMMRSLANVHCEPFVPPPNGVVLFKEAS